MAVDNTSTNIFCAILIVNILIINLKLLLLINLWLNDIFINPLFPHKLQFGKPCVIGSLPVKRLGYVCNPRSLKEGTETSRRRTDDLGSRLERPIHFECKLNEPMHIGMRLLHPVAADHSMSISRQQVQRIFRFSLRSRAGAWPLDVTSEDRRFGIPTKRPRILPLPVSRGSLLCPYFLAQVRAPTKRPLSRPLSFLD